ncbi:IclR family transcriptional regulator [Streptomyces anulatus]|uniref:IclR family transcriptional regulator n=1 Tax=Streptomyces anulatus TaxID=1892 RepID=UPI0033FC6E08|nr:IclR family transcriptional regulator [Streptomyces anulatus]WSU32612.1 IclR family transcriptional regulator [Streptomyces anulatus]WSU88537.1 IclR family transcriptional regulator [Streptomyces anulatus]
MQLVRRALLVVGRLAQRRDGATIQELCDALDIPGASMHRLLAALEEEQFISRHRHSRRIFLGPAAADVGLAARRVAPIGPLLRDRLAELAAQTGEAVLLTELLDNRAICTFRCGGELMEQLSVAVGSTLPLHATAEARTLLIDMSRPEIARLLAGSDLTGYSPRTPRSVSEVFTRVALIRQHGYGVSYDEFDAGIWSLAAPVRNGVGQVVATVAVATAEARVGRPALIDNLRAAVLAMTRAASAELGYQDHL